ncbi:cyclin-dependent protein kinase inhibitor SMR6-like [Lycium ferocissimum]|uniref:cyclin-dependent protein kinase inhibitor SMR6-like n=1 Tax=Lycium ferocissimum TaxID=112874 RepID=UPI002814D9C2|nr:cyclin-dependent protein kinase inhibitor SMR6-like [Lycium ferocissimum]
MGFSKKHQLVDGSKEENKMWVIAGIAFRPKLKSISTKPNKEEFKDEEEERSTTPTARDSRIPEKLPCPPAPVKRRPASTCHYNGAREFFNPPDLESVFIIRHVERANY